MKKLNYLAIAIYVLLGLAITACSNDSNSNNSPNTSSKSEGRDNNSTGKSGSLARFTILDNYLYTVDYGKLNVFNIQDKENPVLVNAMNIGFDIETLFSFRTYLYIGSRNGMFIYDAAKREEPKLLSSVQHFTACDPVIANNSHAYVTLKGGSWCGGVLNVLQVYDIKDITKPILISQRNLLHPVGLAFYQNYLFVCDDEVKIFDITDPANLNLVHAVNRESFDVIILNNLLILVGNEGIYQYSLDPKNIKNINELSTMAI